MNGKVKLLMFTAALVTGGLLLSCRKKSSKDNSIFTTDTAVTSPKSSDPQNKTKVILGKGGDWTVSSLQKSAINGALNDFVNVRKLLKSVNSAELPRPLPNLDSDGKIVAYTALHKPTGKGGLSGKTIIVNPGHGAYNSQTGYFDAGALGVTQKKDSNGKIYDAPFEEWRWMDIYANDLIDSLTAQGATVIRLSGALRDKGGMVDKKFIENLLKGDAGTTEVRNHLKNTSKNNIEFVSLHADAGNATDKGTAVLFRSGDIKDQKLAQNIADEVEKSNKWTTTTYKSQNLYVVRATGDDVPGCLVETEYLTGDRGAKNIPSSDFRKMMINGITQGLIKYWDNSAAANNNVKPAVKPEVKPEPAKEPAKEQKPAAPKTNSKSIEINDAAIEKVAKNTGLSAYFIKSIAKWEGGRSEQYDDKGKPAIGFGHNLSDTEVKKYAGKVTDEQAYELLEQDLKAAVTLVQSTLNDSYNGLNSTQKQALIHLVFNKGKEVFTKAGNEDLLDNLKLLATCKDNKKKADLIDQIAPKLGINRSIRTGEVYAKLSARRLYDIYLFTKDTTIGKNTKVKIEELYRKELEFCTDDKTKEDFNKQFDSWFPGLRQGYKL